jgi:hypothetical protein
LERRQDARRGAGGTLNVAGVTARVLNRREPPGNAAEPRRMTTPRTENDLLHNVHGTAIS